MGDPLLWTDALFIQNSDLISVDGEVDDVATAEGLTLTGQGGLIWRGVEDSGRELLSKLVTFAGFLAGDSLSANHLQAVYNIGTPAVQRTRLLLDNVVVSGANPFMWSEVKAWAVYKTLHTIYRAAANRNLEDRYKVKRDSYGYAARWEYWPQLKMLGLPVVYKPLVTPGAVMAHNPGTFLISAVAGAGSVNGPYDVAITYIDTTVTNPNPNNESNPSAITTLTLASPQVVKVDITGLNPPNGNGSPIDVARSIITTLNATGWNVYVGPSGGTLYKQNATPIPIATKTYQLTGDPVLSGVQAGMGQYANQYLTISDLVQRG